MVSVHVMKAWMLGGGCKLQKEQQQHWRLWLWLGSLFYVHLSVWRWIGTDGFSGGQRLLAEHGERRLGGVVCTF